MCSLGLTTTVAQLQHADVGIYGSTGAGCVAAIAASRSGAQKVILLSVNTHVGGMLTGGLQHTDSANDTVIQGITREFFVRTEQQYPGRPTNASYPPGHNPPGWLFESHIGEYVLNEMLTEAKVTVVRNVVAVTSVTKSNSVVQRISTQGGGEFSASIWIDASYEGEVLERVATMVWGREGRAQYGEKDAGRRGLDPISATVNPWWDSSVPTAQLAAIPHVSADVPVGEGKADLWVQPYDFRLCFTNSPSNRAPITKPVSYNASEWELWRRIYAAKPPRSLGEAGLSCLGPIPNNYSDCTAKGGCTKCDMLGMNHGTDLTGGSWGYPNGTAAERAKIWRKHIEFTRGLLWFWSSDPSVPQRVRNEINSFGHCTDEYDADSDPPHWPHQLYVREAKRLVGDFVWTEVTPNATMRNRSIGLGSYTFDVHYVSRVILRGTDPTKDTVVHEGRVNSGPQYGPQYPPAPGPSPAPAPVQRVYACVGEPSLQRCVEQESSGSSGGTADPHCEGGCAPLGVTEWLAVRHSSRLSDDNKTLTVTSGHVPLSNITWLKKSETPAATLSPAMLHEVHVGEAIILARPATTADATYYLVELPQTDEGAGSLTNVIQSPFEMPYDVLLPQRSEVSNVLSAVAISCTHIRQNAIRMEPTWMILGQAAGAAAAFAMQTNVSVHDIDVGRLQKLLLGQRQKITP